MKFAFNRNILLVLLLLFCFLNGTVYWALYTLHQPILRVSFLNVGQGDSILIQSPTGKEILVDGGPDRSVLREVGKVLGPLDRSLDMVVETHPDKDHIFGLTSIFENYAVTTFLEPGIESDTVPAKALSYAVMQEPSLDKRIARRGQRIFIGGGAYMDVLYPYQNDVSHFETNDGSVVLKVVYGNTSFLLTGDLPSVYEDKLIALDAGKGELRSDVLKAGHHGSKYSTDALWLDVVQPKTLVISAGKDNSYGHPSPFTLRRAARANTRVISTIQKGTITFISNSQIVTER